MATLQNLRKTPKVQFRVLIIGRANAGKTTILQRFCDTTEGPEIYRPGPQGTRERVQRDPNMERGLYNIEDELVFSAHDGYIFYDSRGFEAGSEEELKIVQEFVRRKSRERRLENRLHAIWYCIPMDNVLPSLDLKYFEDICPDKYVPVIAVFTKFDQFRRNIAMKLEDQHRDPALLDLELETVFEEHYLSNLPESTPFVRLERMHKSGQRCTDLIETTANVLSSGTVALMLLAKQKNDLEKSINQAVKWAVSDFTREPSTERIIKLCIAAFMSIWYLESQQREVQEVQEESLPTKKEKKKKLFWKNLKLLLKKWMSFAVKKEADKEEEAVKEAEEPEDFSREGLDEEGERRLDELLDEFFEEEDFFFRSRSEANAIFSKLIPFFANPPLLVSTDDHLHRQLIGTILILDQACLSYASSLKPTRDEALDRAYSQYRASDIHNEVMRQFSAPAKEYAILQFTEFILTHRLS